MILSFTFKWLYFNMFYILGLYLGVQNSSFFTKKCVHGVVNKNVFAVTNVTEKLPK